MPIYNKLVRDRIPEIIESTGKTFTSRILSNEEYIAEINKKMHEELAEYEAAETNAETIEELSDLLELIHAAAAVRGVSFEELENVRKDRMRKRGGFNDRIFLMEVQDD